MNFIALSRISGIDSGIDMQAVVLDRFASIFGIAAVAMTLVIVLAVAWLCQSEARRSLSMRLMIKERSRRSVGVKIEESADLASV